MLQQGRKLVLPTSTSVSTGHHAVVYITWSRGWFTGGSNCIDSPTSDITVLAPTLVQTELPAIGCVHHFCFTYAISSSGGISMGYPPCVLGTPSSPLVRPGVRGVVPGSLSRMPCANVQKHQRPLRCSEHQDDRSALGNSTPSNSPPQEDQTRREGMYHINCGDKPGCMD